MKIYPIVEGQGEVAAVPVLLRRLIHDEAQCFDVQVGRPIRRKQYEFHREDSLGGAVKLASLQQDCAGILVLFDGEDDCPATTGERVRAWAQIAAPNVPCEVVLAYREYESWFLAGLESLRGHFSIAAEAQAPSTPESRRNAKGALEEFMRPGASYSPTIHQAPISATLDLGLVHRRSRSFRKLTKSIGSLLMSVGRAPAAWPPPHWLTP